MVSVYDLAGSQSKFPEHWIFRMHKNLASRFSGSRLPRVLTLVAVAGLAAGLGGCERSQDAYEQAVADARDAMMILTAGGSTPDALEAREPQLARVIADLNRAMASVDGDAKAPAQLIIARATAGQGEIQMIRASEAASDLLLSISKADSVAREYSNNRAHAVRLVGPDAGQATRRVEADIREIDTQIRSLESEREELLAQLTGVNNEIAQMLQSARGERLAEADLRTESFNAEPMRRAELIEQAVERSRAAESYERAAAEKELTAGSLELAISHIQRAIENQQALRGIQSLGLQRIADFDAELARSRREREQAASQTLSDYMRAIETVISSYESDFIAALDDAISKYNSAAGLARQARAMGQVASVSSGEFASTAARLHELHAQVARQIAASAQYLVNIDASDKGRFQAIVNRFEGIAEQAISEAANAYEQAASGFGGSGEIGAQLADRYNARAAEFRGIDPNQPAPDDWDEYGDEDAPGL